MSKEEGKMPMVGSGDEPPPKSTLTPTLTGLALTPTTTTPEQPQANPTPLNYGSRYSVLTEPITPPPGGGDWPTTYHESPRSPSPPNNTVPQNDHDYMSPYGGMQRAGAGAGTLAPTEWALALVVKRPPPPPPRPLVVLLDGRDCSLEMPYLEGIATVGFCDAKTMEDVAERVIEEAVGVFLWGNNFQLRKDDLAKFKALKIVVKLGCGLENVDVEGAGDLGIAVSKIPNIGVEEVADSTMSLILNLYRKTYWLANDVQRDPDSVFCPERVFASAVGSSRIRGEKLGIVGLGRVGKAVVLRAKAFGFNIVFFDPFIPEGYERSLGIERADTLLDLLKMSDCVSLHCSMNSTTHHLINEVTISNMRPGAFLVNTASGGLIDEKALARALKIQWIRAAALDVFDNQHENVFDGPLKDVANVICTPNTAFYTPDSGTEMRIAAAEEVQRAVIGKFQFQESLKFWVNQQYFRKHAIRPQSIFFAPQNGNPFVINGDLIGQFRYPSV